MDSNPSVLAIITSVITALITGNLMQWREIKRLNEERLKDMRQIGLQNIRTTRNFTLTAKKLLNKLDGNHKDEL
jgi:hypothetical protein